MPIAPGSGLVVNEAGEACGENGESNVLGGRLVMTCRYGDIAALGVPSCGRTDPKFHYQAIG
jgi:hypothetical protein